MRFPAARLAALFVCAVGPAHAQPLPSEPVIGHIEPVHAFWDEMPTGVSVSSHGRIFLNFPRWGDNVPVTVGELKGGRIVPFPSTAMNRPDTAHPADTLISVQSVVVDADDRLWILDTAAPSFHKPIPGGAKLVAVDLATNKVVRTIVMPTAVVKPTTYLNDARFDLRQGKGGTAYITDSGSAGLIVVDLASGQAWRRLADQPSTRPDPSFVPIVEGETLAVREAGKKPRPFAAASDGIALSADGTNLFYCPLSSRHLFSVPTALLRDRSVPEAQVEQAVRDLGEKGASDGLEADSAGRVYAGDYEHDSIRVREADGEWRTIAHDPRILWPDTLSVARDGYLYFTSNQLEDMPRFHDGYDLRRKPYSLFRIRINAVPVALR
jgi:sugar lactone lactonase YvrE